MDEQTVGKKLKKIVTSLTDISTHVHQLKDGEDSRKLLQSEFNDLIEKLKGLEDFFGQVESDEVPIELVAALDSGTHPDAWFKGELSRLTARHREEQSKASAIMEFSSELSKLLGVERRNQAAADSSHADTDYEVIID